MAGEYRIGFSAEAQRLIEASWARAPEVVARELTAFMDAATERLREEAIERTPTSGSGHLKQSIIGEVRSFDRGLGVEGIVGTPLDYAVPVELGAKPHWIPDEKLGPLMDWVKRRGLAVVTPYPRGTPKAKREKMGKRRADELLRVTKAIRFSIWRKGTSQWQRDRHGKPGAEMFLETFDRNRATLLRDFEAMARRVAEQLGAV